MGALMWVCGFVGVLGGAVRLIVCMYVHDEWEDGRIGSNMAKLSRIESLDYLFYSHPRTSHRSSRGECCVPRTMALRASTAWRGISIYRLRRRVYTLHVYFISPPISPKPHHTIANQALPSPSHPSSRRTLGPPLRHPHSHASPNSNPTTTPFVHTCA